MLGRAGRGARRTRMLAAGATLAVMVASGLLAVDQPAAAQDFAAACGANGCPEGGGGGSGGGGISVRVWGSATTAGEGGYEEFAPESVPYDPACYYNNIASGHDAWHDPLTKASLLSAPYPGEQPRFTEEMLREHKDDEGFWWHPTCEWPAWEEQGYPEDWVYDHSVVFVEEGEPEPVPEIPPEVLMEIAEDAMELPDPEVSWNPKRDGDGATLVNVDTWFWLADGLVDLEVHAAASGNTATVEATLSEMGFSSPAAGTVTCDGFGKEWSAGAEDTDCKLTFLRSSASMPNQVTPVHVESNWDVEWFYNEEPQGPLDGQTTEQDFSVPVAEAQARVVG